MMHLRPITLVGKTTCFSSRVPGKGALLLWVERDCGLVNTLCFCIPVFHLRQLWLPPALELLTPGCIASAGRGFWHHIGTRAAPCRAVVSPQQLETFTLFKLNQSHCHLPVIYQDLTCRLHIKKKKEGKKSFFAFWPVGNKGQSSLHQLAGSSSPLSALQLAVALLSALAQKMPGQDSVCRAQPAYPAGLLSKNSPESKSEPRMIAIKQGQIMCPSSRYHSASLNKHS